jgi:hypothetical protein
MFRGREVLVKQRYIGSLKATDYQELEATYARFPAIHYLRIVLREGNSANGSLFEVL